MLSNKTFYACCGYGDLFWRLPLIEAYSKPCCLLGGQWYRGKGIPQLIKTLVPNARLRFTDHIDYRWDKNFYHQPYSGLSIVERECRRFNLKLKTTLSDKSISRIEPLPEMEGEDYLVVHACPSGKERMWKWWKKIKFPLPIKVVGSVSDVKFFGDECFGRDFYWTARLIRGSKGVVCANSAIMQLSNILGAKIVCIYTQEDEKELWRCNGLSLTNPTAEEVSEAIKNYIF